MDPAPLLRELSDDDRPVLDRLWQLYSHDMSEVRGTLPNPEGKYKDGRLPGYFDNPDTCGYLICVRDSPAGFAFVGGLTGDVRTIGDFFVVRAARRERVGYRVARELFARHPGRWEIGFQAGNGGAPDFWRRLAADVAGSDWREETRPVPDKPHIPHDHFVLFSS